MFRAIRQVAEKALTQALAQNKVIQTAAANLARAETNFKTSTSKVWLSAAAKEIGADVSSLCEKLNLKDNHFTTQTKQNELHYYRNGNTSASLHDKSSKQNNQHESHEMEQEEEEEQF